MEPWLPKKRSTLYQHPQAHIPQDFQAKMISLQHRREELEIKEQQLAESLMKFDRFLKENDARRKRALKKAAEEKDVIKQKDKDIGTLTAELQRLRKQISIYEKWISKQEIFEKFLRSVLQHTNDYTEISELMDRYATLSSTNKVVWRCEPGLMFDLRS